MRENEKLARQLSQRDRQQGQSNGKRVYVVEDDHPVHEVKKLTTQSSFSIFLSLGNSIK